MKMMIVCHRKQQRSFHKNMSDYHYDLNDLNSCKFLDSHGNIQEFRNDLGV